MQSSIEEQKLFEFMLCNRIDLLFLHFCVKSELEEQRSHKVVTVMSIEFDLLLVSLQYTDFRTLHNSNLGGGGRRVLEGVLDSRSLKSVK